MPGQGLKAVVAELAADATWMPRYVQWDQITADAAEQNVSVGNGGGVHLNQYTVTMQLMMARGAEHGKKALLQTAKWNESKAVVFLHEDGEIGIDGGAWKKHSNAIDRRSWATVSIVVDTAAGQLQVCRRTPKQTEPAPQKCTWGRSHSLVAPRQIAYTVMAYVAPW